MKKRELWLKLFSENDTALATAIHLCERFVTPESLERSQDFIMNKRRELNEEIDPQIVAEIFPESSKYCFPCRNQSCAYSSNGVCKFALVHGKAPVRHGADCISFCIK